MKHLIPVMIPTPDIPAAGTMTEAIMTAAMTMAATAKTFTSFGRIMATAMSAMLAKGIATANAVAPARRAPFLVRW